MEHNHVIVWITDGNTVQQCYEYYLPQMTQRGFKLCPEPRDIPVDSPISDAITYDEAASLYGCKPSTIRQYVSRGKLENISDTTTPMVSKESVVALKLATQS